MKKHKISELFLYRHRFGIGYFLLSIAFTTVLFLMPLISPSGLSEAEMQSTVDSYSLDFNSMLNGNIVDLPYRALQKVSIRLFGLSAYSISLPSIIIGLFLGVLLILLLNRWFKNTVALIASILTVLSAPFLYLVGFGTPLIMLVFWPTLLLWLGSKIQGVNKPRTSYCFLFALALFLSVFTPYMIYLAVFIFIYAMTHPHLRFTIKNLPKIPFFIATLIVITGTGLIIYNAIKYPNIATELLFTNDFSFRHFFSNISTGFLPFFSWTGNVESTLLAPMIGLANIALAIAGLISTTKGFFASRNSIATLLIVFTLLITGFTPDCAILIILPLAILTAHGIRYILEKWYNLFPENPYARIFAIFPIGLFLGIIIISSTSHYIFGYRYNPTVANEFNDDLALIRENLAENTTLVIQDGTLEYDFYHILDNTTNFKVTTTFNTASAPIATLGKWPNAQNHQIDRIITSSKSTNSDRIYIYK